MKDVVQPLSAAPDPDSWDRVIAELYEISDNAAEERGHAPAMRQPLSDPEDVALVDDVLDALLDPDQARMARPVLRHALKEIARTALVKRRPEGDLLS